MATDIDAPAAYLEARKGKSSILLSLLPGGRLVVQDHSESEDRVKLTQRLREMGVNTAVVFESLCG